MNAKDVVGIVQGSVTTLAIIIGGIWLILRRQIFPRLEIKHNLSQWPIMDEKILIRLCITVKNIGVVKLRLFNDAGFIRVSSLPIRDSDNLNMSVDQSIFIRGGEGPWYDLFEWKLSGIAEDGIPIDIEPGESDEFHFDFILPLSTTTITIYTYICARKRKLHLRFRPKISLIEPIDSGWHMTTIYNITSYPINERPQSIKGEQDNVHEQAFRNTL